MAESPAVSEVHIARERGERRGRPRGGPRISEASHLHHVLVLIERGQLAISPHYVAAPVYPPSGLDECSTSPSTFQVALHRSCHLSATLRELSKKIGHVNAAHLHVRAECRVGASQSEGKIACGMPAMSLRTEISEEHLFGQYSQV